MALILDLLIRHAGFIAAITLLHRHLAGEIARGDGIHTDARPRKLLTHHAGQVRRGRFGGVVAEVRLAVAHQAGHGGDNDDAGVVAPRGALQER